MTRTDRLSRGRKRVIASLVVLTAGLLPFSTAEAKPRGPRLGNNRYVTSIEPVGAATVDVDDYVGPLYEGELLTVKVKAKGKDSALLPHVELLGPDGQVQQVELRVRKKGRAVVLPKFLVPETGAWAVRISGNDGTTGEYVVTFRVKGSPQAVRKAVLGDGPPPRATHDFTATRGSRLDVTLKWNTRRDSVEIRSLEGPAGTVTGGTLETKYAARGAMATTRLVHEDLPTDGAYILVLGSPAPSDDVKLAAGGNGNGNGNGGTRGNGGSYDVTISVTDTQRPRSKRVKTELTSAEPAFGPVAAPTRGHAGLQVTYQAINLSTSPEPQFFVGGVPATVVSVTDSEITAVVPPGPSAGVVEVEVVNPDGQAARLDAAYEYVAPPVLTGIRRLNDSAAPGGSIGGGNEVKLLGTGFNDQDQVRFGGTAAVSSFVSATELRVTVPAVASPTTVNVYVMDEFARESASPFVYEYKVAPALSGPYSPAQVRVSGGTVVTVNGSGFASTDVVFLNGNSVAKTFIAADTFTFTAPALPPGSYSVSVRDVFGTDSDGPDLVVKAPPTIIDLLDAGGNVVRAGDVAGGEQLRLIGTNLTAQDTVRFGSTAATVTQAVGSSRLDVTVPSGSAPGALNLTVTDAVGQQASSSFQYTYTLAVPTLVNGTGWTGATSAPAGYGSPAAGHDAKVIARWDAVPYQTVTDTFYVGIAAFHINGIARVEMSANNGTWVVMTKMVKNPRTDVWEYTAELDPTDFPDGLVELRAKVFPKNAGIPRLLAGPVDGSTTAINGNFSMFVSTNANGTLSAPVAYCSPSGSDSSGNGTSNSPYRTPTEAFKRIQQANNSCDGATVYLKAGNYTWGPPPWPYPVTSTRYAVVKPAPGVTRSQVVFNSNQSSGYRTKLIRAENVTFHDTTPNSNLRLTSVGSMTSLGWFSNCRLIGPGRLKDSGFFTLTNWSQIYFTGCEVSDNRNGIRSATFIRDCYVHTLSGSPFGAANCVINSRSDGYDDSNTNFHGDVFHWFPFSNNTENFILYNLDVTDFENQGLFAEVFQGNDVMDNVAVVNVHISKNAVSAEGSWWETNTNHLLLWHVSLPDQPFRWAQQQFGTTLENVSIIGCSFLAWEKTRLPSSAVIKHNHWVDPNYFASFQQGTDISLGAPRYVNAAGFDYDLQSNSPLIGRVSTPVVPADCRGDKRATTNTAIGAFRGPGE